MICYVVIGLKRVLFFHFLLDFVSFMIILIENVRYFYFEDYYITNLLNSLFSRSLYLSLIFMALINLYLFNFLLF